MAETEKPRKEMSCMEKTMQDIKRRKEMMGPTNREIMNEIIELKKMIKDLSYQLASHA